MHILDQETWNSFVVHSKQGGSKSHLQFTLGLTEQITEKYEIGKPQPGHPSPVFTIMFHGWSFY